MDAHRCFSRFWSVLAVTFLAAFMAQVAPAHAQDASPDVLNKVTKLNKKALDAYQKKDFDAARSLLKDALDLCSNSGLDKHPITARTHIHLGIVLIGGFKQRDAGIKHFKKALQIQPDIQLTKTVATPALQDAFEEAMVSQTVGGGGDDSDRGGQPQADDDQNVGGAGDSAGGDDSQPPPRRKVVPKKKKRRSDDDDQDGASVAKRHGDDDDDEDDHVGANNAGRIFVGLTLGSGFGIASGTGELASTNKHELAGAGLAPAQLLHIAPEVGYFINSNLMLSLQGRYQIVTGVNPGSMTCGTTACSSKTSAIAVFARATYVMLDGDFHLFFGGEVGGGAIRHVINFPADKTCGTAANGQTCVDTLQAGPFLVGPNAGIIYDLGKTAALIVALNTQLGVPKFTFNVDVNAGLGLKF
jgi:tetratricopeptide (TPR) repeat protein